MPWKAPLIGAIGGIANGLFGGLFQGNQVKKSQARQHAYNKAILDYQWENSTPEQIASMQRAGLNVGLANSNGGPSMSATSGNVSGGNFSAPDFSGAIASMSNIMADLRLKETQAEKNEAETNTEKVQTLIAQKDLIGRDLDLIAKRLANAKTEDERKVLQQEYKNKQLEYDEIGARIDNLTASSEYYRSSASLNDAKVITENELRAGKYKSQQLDNEIKQFEKDYIEKWQEKMPTAGVPGAVAQIAHALAGSHKIRTEDLDNPANLKGLLSKDYIKSLIPEYLHPVADHFLNQENIFDKDYFLWDYIREIRKRRE